MYPLVEIITRISTIIPVFSTWETCASSLIEKTRPSSAYFFCKSTKQCPNNGFYKLTDIPTQTSFQLQTQVLPLFKYSDMVFIAAHKDNVEWNNETIQRYRLGGDNEFKLVIIADMSNNIEDDLRYMGKLFQALWESGIVNSAVMLKNDTSAQIFTYLPFKSDGPCEDTSPVVLGECAAVGQTVFDEKVNNMHQCPIRISLTEDTPVVGFPLSGRYAFLVEEIALRMNSSLETMLPQNNDIGKVCGEGEFTGLRGYVAHGKAHMGLGNFNPQACSVLSYVGLSYFQCLAWCTPILKSTGYIYVFIFQQLRPPVWAALLASTFLVVVSVLLLGFLSREVASMKDVVYLALLLFAVVPMKEIRTTPLRLVVAIWLFACLVVQTVYQGELKSQSAVPLGSQIIEGLQELADADLTLCSAMANLDLLKQAEEPIIQIISKMSEACNGTLHENILRAAHEKNRAVFTSDIRCSLAGSELSRNAAWLYPRTGGCFKGYQIIYSFHMANWTNLAKDRDPSSSRQYRYIFFLSEMRGYQRRTDFFLLQSRFIRRLYRRQVVTSGTNAKPPRHETSTETSTEQSIQVSPIVTTRGSPFKRIWRTVMQRTIESGLFERWLDIKPVKPEPGQVSAFSLGHLLPALFVLGLGWLCGFTALLAEHFFNKTSTWSKFDIFYCTRTATLRKFPADTPISEKNDSIQIRNSRS